MCLLNEEAEKMVDVTQWETEFWLDSRRDRLTALRDFE